MSTDPWAQDRQNFVRTSNFFSFYLELDKNKFRNLIRTSKFKFSFWGLYIIWLKSKNLDLEGREIKYIFLRDRNQEDIH